VNRLCKLQNYKDIKEQMTFNRYDNTISWRETPSVVAEVALADSSSGAKLKWQHGNIT
jgi:hypothetical protein